MRRATRPTAGPLAVLAALVLGLGAASCTGLPESRSPGQDLDWVRDDTNPTALGVRMSEFANRYASRIARTADRIATEAESADVRRAALTWKADAVSLGNTTTLRTDALAALIDTWALLAQMRQYLESGPGAGLFGDAQPLAVEAVAALEEEIRAIALTAVEAEKLDDAEGLVRDAVERYPVEGPLYTRVSPIFDHADLAYSPRKIGDVATNLNDRVSSFSRQVTLYAADLPRQARWQAELLVEEPLRVLAEALEQLVPVIVGLPDVLHEQRELIVAALTTLVQEQQDSVLQSIDEQRQDTIEVLRAERVALTSFIEHERELLLAEVERQRLETLEFARAEREIVLAAVSDERDDTVTDVRGLLAELVPEARDLVDHAFLRLAQGLVALALLGLLALAFLRARRRAPSG